MLERRRSWTIDVDGDQHRVDVVYAALSGWMTIEVDNERCARGWREWQTVLGGAVLSCKVGVHELEARVTQPWGRQDYAFALRVDGQLQLGSDVQPQSGALKRQTLLAIGGLALALFLIGVLRGLAH
jgi:hypothetical protein